MNKQRHLDQMDYGELIDEVERLRLTLGAVKDLCKHIRSNRHHSDGYSAGQRNVANAALAIIVDTAKTAASAGAP